MRTLIAIAALVACSGAWADVTLPKNLQENTVASATDVMDNFNALANEANSQDARITIVEQSVGGGTITRTFTFSGWVDDQKGDGPYQANQLCAAEHQANFVAASLDAFAEAVKYGAQISFPPPDGCGVLIKSYTSSSWWQYVSSTGNLDYPTTTCNAKSSIMCGYWN